MIFRPTIQGFYNVRLDSNVGVYLQSLREKKSAFIAHLAYWLALAAYVLFVLISSGDFLQSWALVWLAGLVGLAAAPVVPSLGPLIYLAVTYSVPRYTPPYDLINKIALPETIAYFAIFALIIERFTSAEKIELGGFSGGMMIGLWLVLGLSAINAIWNGSRWDPSGIAPMGGLNQTWIMFLLGVNVLSTRAGIIGLSITLLLTVLLRVVVGGLKLVPGDHDLAYLTAVVFPVLLGLSLIKSHSISLNLTMVVSAIFLLAVLASTRNRGAMVGLTGGMLVLWLRSPRKVMLALLAVVMLGGVYLFLPWKDFVSRFTTIGIDQSSEGRLNVWHAAIKMIANNPILGVGLGNFQEKSLQYGENPVMGALVAHNNFLHVAGEGGLLALAAYTGLIGATFLAAFRLCRAPVPWLRVSGRIIEASMVGYVIAGMFLSRHNFALAYLLMGLASGLGKLAERQGPIDAS